MNRLKELTINPEGFVFDPSGGEMFTVNAAGLGIIKGLQEHKTEQAIADELSSRYRVSAEQAEKDIFDFKTQLRLFQLI